MRDSRRLANAVAADDRANTVGVASGALSVTSTVVDLCVCEMGERATQRARNMETYVGRRVNLDDTGSAGEDVAGRASRGQAGSRGALL